MSDVCTQGFDTGFVTLGYAKVALLGVVQGITELLPISSTAHMRVVPALLGWPDPGSAFSAIMQLAALAAVVSYFWKDVLATVPIGIAGLALAPLLNECGSPLRSVAVIGWACLAMSLLLALAELVCR